MEHSAASPGSCFIQRYSRRNKLIIFMFMNRDTVKGAMRFLPILVSLIKPTTFQGKCKILSLIWWFSEFFHCKAQEKDPFFSKSSPILYQILTPHRLLFCSIAMLLPARCRMIVRCNRNMQGASIANWLLWFFHLADVIQSRLKQGNFNLKNSKSSSL